jgi:hypothetical protein
MIRMPEFTRGKVMNYLRQLFRLMFGTTAKSFNEMQREELDKLMDKQAESRGVYMSDLVDQIEASTNLAEKLALRVAKDESELNKLLLGE